MSEVQKHYVYACYVDDEIKYIGHGVGMRYKHCLMGTSSCGELNRDFYAGKTLIVKKLHKGLSKKEAEKIEEQLIRDNFENVYNKVIKYTPRQSIPNVQRKKGYTVLANTWSLGDEEKYYNEFLQSKGLDDKRISKIEDSLCLTGLCLYIVKDGTSSPMIVIDKVKDSDVEKWHANVFSHLAHPDGNWNWQEGMELELEKY